MLPALVTAWRNLAAYPEGHPARQAALATAHARLQALLVNGPLALGVSRDFLIHGEERLDAAYVRPLALALFRRGVAVLRLEPELTLDELGALLARLQEREGDGPLDEALREAGVSSVRAQVIDYGAITASSEVERQAAEPASLWEAILKTVLSGRELDERGNELGFEETFSARGIVALFQSGQLDASGAEGAARAVAHHLSRTSGPARSAAIHQVAELLRSLPEAVRERVLALAMRVVASESSADSLLHLASALSPDSVLRALRQVAGDGFQLSPHALRLIQALTEAARQLDHESPQARQQTAALVEQLKQVFEDEDVDRFNPEDHAALLDQAAGLDLAQIERQQLDPLDPGERASSLEPAAVEAALFDTLIELLGSSPTALFPPLLRRLEAIVSRALGSGDVARAIAALDAVVTTQADPATPLPARNALSGLLANVAEGDSAARLLGALPETAEARAQAETLIARLGSGATRGLLRALAEEKDQSRRRKLFDFLSSLGSVIVPEAAKLLADQRWFVVRNMLALLRKVGDRGSLDEVRRCAEAKDLRVRLEAIKTLLAFDPRVPRRLLESAINDPDPKLAEAAIVLVGQYGIHEARDPLVGLLRKWDFVGAQRTQRLKALRALADLGDAAVLARIDRFFWNWRLPLVSLEERRAAYRALEAFPEAARGPYLERGLASRDAQIREVCRRILAERGARTAPEAPNVAWAEHEEEGR